MVGAAEGLRRLWTVDDHLLLLLAELAAAVVHVVVRQ